MDYFLMFQDKKLSEAIQPVGITRVIPDEFFDKGTPLKTDEGPIQFYLKDGWNPVYVDFIERPISLISDKLKPVIEKYQREVFFKPVILGDRKRMKQEVYWRLIPPSRSCLSEQSEFYPTKTIKKLVLDSRKVTGYHIFQIGGIMEKLIVVDLALAESILRRYPTGVCFQKIEQERKEEDD